ncbi:ABC transporter ATP-binding protein [Oceanobacillus sp. J11TS1]|uniref:ABC transporter ATP-binding protein n=1 Tax=Oceanobacillus sp. J11TS1 TaxID=2807191 RepID=UPI001B0D5D16|nr:ABC transporter ATP-binding protein [Oceanobacillus sp. J11TS1]GIO24946.1 putative ABC transporter ATP-binding protein YtlC [Oceanobacillus sp. J11TS1]
MSYLTLDRVSHYYFSKKQYTEALHNISFFVRKNEFVSLLGPSGCGKSTLLSLISGMLQPAEGEILINGEKMEISDIEIGYMLQQDYLFPWKTIIDNVLIGPKIRKRQTGELKQKAISLLKEVGLENVAEKYPSELSGGMRQRAALIRTLITEPEILLLDEPFSALDFQTKLKLEVLVSDLLKAYQKTAVLVTHDIGEAISMSDRIILMSSHPGRVAKMYEVPVELRDESPFLVRKHPKYGRLFDKIWADLNQQNQTVNPLEENES